MNESMRSPEGEAMYAKAAETAEFLREVLNKNPDDLEALFEQIGIKSDSDESEWLALAMGQENYIAMSEDKRSRVDDMVQSLKNAIESESGME